MPALSFPPWREFDMHDHRWLCAGVFVVLLYYTIDRESREQGPGMWPPWQGHGHSMPAAPVPGHPSQQPACLLIISLFQEPAQSVF